MQSILNEIDSGNPDTNCILDRLGHMKKVLRANIGLSIVISQVPPWGWDNYPLGYNLREVNFDIDNNKSIILPPRIETIKLRGPSVVHCIVNWPQTLRAVHFFHNAIGINEMPVSLPDFIEEVHLGIVLAGHIEKRMQCYDYSIKHFHRLGLQSYPKSMKLLKFKMGGATYYGQEYMFYPVLPILNDEDDRSSRIVKFSDPNINVDPFYSGIIDFELCAEGECTSFMTQSRKYGLHGEFCYIDDFNINSNPCQKYKRSGGVPIRVWSAPYTSMHGGDGLGHLICGIEFKNITSYNFKMGSNMLKWYGKYDKMREKMKIET